LPFFRFCLFSLLTAVSVQASPFKTIGLVSAWDPEMDALDLAQVTAPRVSIHRPDGSKATVVIGGTGMSGPIFLDDRSFRDFAFQKWHARIHEMEGTAIAQVGYSNRVPILIVRAPERLGRRSEWGQSRRKKFSVSG
jgi:adenosylhomocysteine nucleosidase